MEQRIFFPNDKSDGLAAKTICRRCTVRAECLAEALGDPGLVGVWGGTTERDRRVLRRALSA